MRVRSYGNYFLLIHVGALPYKRAQILGRNVLSGLSSDVEAV
jgi:hypothetical protein